MSTENPQPTPEPQTEQLIDSLGINHSADSIFDAFGITEEFREEMREQIDSVGDKILAEYEKLGSTRKSVELALQMRIFLELLGVPPTKEIIQAMFLYGHYRESEASPEELLQRMLGGAIKK